jgi:hypothetical protein
MIATFIFYNESVGKPRFYCDKDFQHVDVSCYDGSDHILFRLDNNGLQFRRIKSTNIVQFIRALRGIKTVIAIVTIYVNHRANYRWFPLWIKSCNEQARVIAGVNINFTFNPRSLYKKLLKLTVKSNYDILDAWRRKDGRWRRFRSGRIKQASSG